MIGVLFASLNLTTAISGRPPFVNYTKMLNFVASNQNWNCYKMCQGISCHQKSHYPFYFVYIIGKRVARTNNPRKTTRVIRVSHHMVIEFEKRLKYGLHG